jgi:hypothetical protein
MQLNLAPNGSCTCTFCQSAQGADRCYRAGSSPNHHRSLVDKTCSFQAQIRNFLSNAAKLQESAFALCRNSTNTGPISIAPHSSAIHNLVGYNDAFLIIHDVVHKNSKGRVLPLVLATNVIFFQEICCTDQQYVTKRILSEFTKNYLDLVQ